MLKLSIDKSRYEFDQPSCHSRLNRSTYALMNSWIDEFE